MTVISELNIYKEALQQIADNPYLSPDAILAQKALDDAINIHKEWIEGIKRSWDEGWKNHRDFMKLF